MSDMTRDKLQAQLEETHKKGAGIFNQIKAIDYEKRILDAKQKYEGKCFQWTPSGDDIKCMFIYEINKECQLNIISIDYHVDENKITKFEIEYSFLFIHKFEDPYTRWQWIEITKQEFLNHFQQIKNWINELSI